MKNLIEFDALFESYLPAVTDHEILAATLVGEAGAEDEKGMTAVLNVLKNRAKKKGTTKAGEALRPYRFSMWNDATKNVSDKKDYRVPTIRNIINKFKPHDKWTKAITLIKSDPKDITGGANCYYAYKGPNAIGAPDFTRGWKKTVDIGNHRFGYVENL
jgi:Cell Wall Hydrolase